jgi:hypothetical protein
MAEGLARRFLSDTNLCHENASVRHTILINTRLLLTPFFLLVVDSAPGNLASIRSALEKLARRPCTRVLFISHSLDLMLQLAQDLSLLVRI